MNQEEIKQLIREELANLLGLDKYTFQNHIQIFDKRNIQLGRTTGTKIGTATDQKIGLYGVTPVIQAGAISAPTGGTPDTQARTAINSLITALHNIGIIA